MPIDNVRFDKDDEETDGGPSRRKLMAAGAATWATATVAGCQDQESSPTATPADEDTPTATPEPQTPTYVVTDEMATAGAFGVSFASSCSPTRLFAPGMGAVWEINVYDPETGENLADDAIDSVTVNVDGAGSLDAEWIGDAEEHPAPIWEAYWEIPADTEPGEWTYTIEVAASDSEAEVRTVGRATGSFIVQEDNMPDFYVSTETYWNGGPDALPEGTGGFVGTCAPEREFFPSMDPTFYVQIYETESGDLVGAPMDEEPTPTPTPTETGEGEPSSAEKIAGSTIDSVTVSFPDGPFDDLELEWMSGIGDSHTVPHWGATLTDPETLPTGSYTWQVDMGGVNGGDAPDDEDVKIVGAASDVFNVIEK
jgi:hypothetical protein